MGMSGISTKSVTCPVRPVVSQFRKDWARLGGTAVSACPSPAGYKPGSEPPALPPGMANPAPSIGHSRLADLLLLGLGEKLLPRKLHRFHLTKYPKWQDEPRP